MNPVYRAVAKASGKVLIAGGYGVLEEGNYGLSLAVDSCFYCICTGYQEEYEGTRIWVSSHQIGQSWEYRTK